MTDSGTGVHTSGAELHELVTRLFPITRSITGDGVRRSLAMLGELIDVEVTEIPSGTDVLDWTVPEEWVFREAWIESLDGQRLVDTADSNLHVVNYSAGVDTVVDGEELQKHLHSLPDQPDAIPYRTSYYHRDWGFCVSDRCRRSLGPGPFRVRVDAEHIAGSLTYGEFTVPGATSDEILVSTHVCHPSLANDNLSGMVLAAALARHLAQGSPRHTWRFVFVPGTIGSISWLAQNRNDLDRITDGLVITGLGDTSDFTWKKTRRGDHRIDRLVAAVLAEMQVGHQQVEFSPYGYDERQYGSPGFDLPVGRLSRGVHGTFPEYHTSGDNLSFVTPDGLDEALGVLVAIADGIEADRRFLNLEPHGEPMLGRRGLYSSLGARPSPGDAQMAMLWVLNLSDGSHSLLDIAQRSGLGLLELASVAQILVDHELLRPL